MSAENNSKKRVKTRESGHYWVKWAGLTPYYGSPDIWRMGSYHEGEGWKLPGEERLYHDGDFIKINENRIPFTKGRLHSGWVYWATMILNVAAFLYYTLYILTHT